MRISMILSTFGVVALLGWSANAQPLRDDPRRAEATKLVEEGMVLHDQNNENAALEKYEQAYALYPSPNILLNLARQEQLVGKKLKALRHFREAVRNPLLPAAGVAYAKKYISEMEPGFGRIDIKGPNGLVVSIGSEEVKLPLPEPLDVEPGMVTASGTLDGERYDGSAEAAIGRVTAIELKPSSSESTYWTGQHITGVTLGGLAVVALSAGFGFLVAHQNHVSDGKNLLSSTPNACANSDSVACQDLRNMKDSANRAKTGEIISFVAAGALAAGAAVLLWPTSNKEGQSGSARIVPTGNGILIDGAF